MFFDSHASFLLRSSSHAWASLLSARRGSRVLGVSWCVKYRGVTSVNGLDVVTHDSARREGLSRSYWGRFFAVRRSLLSQHAHFMALHLDSLGFHPAQNQCPVLLQGWGENRFSPREISITANDRSAAAPRRCGRGGSSWGPWLSSPQVRTIAPRSNHSCIPAGSSCRSSSATSAPGHR